MTSSFQNRIDEMEKRIKADTEAKVKARIPNTLNVEAIGDTSGCSSRSSPITLSHPHLRSSGSSRSLDLQITPQTPCSGSQLTSSSSTVNISRPPYAGSPYSTNSSPSPGDGSSIFHSNSATNSPSTPLSAGFALGRPGSAGNLGFEVGLAGPRKRQFLPLDYGVSTQNSSNSAEIEQRYAEIMKQAGVLTINGQKIPSDISELRPIGELGQGTCGHVVKMVHQKTNQVMAVKQMRRSGNFEDNKRIIMDLDVVIKSHSCPYIVQCIGTFITGTEVWICMELMATCLDKLSKSLADPIPENILGKITVATVNALHYLKEHRGVIHRDVKPSNILLDEKGMIKLCDFGISGHLVDSKAKTRNAGCAAYMAPERIVPPDPSKPDYDIRADVWSLGLSLVELATGEFPYKNCKTDFEMLTKVLEDDQPALPPGKNFSMDFRDFVTQCLTKDYHRRPKYKKLLEHNFVLRYSSLPVDVANWYRVVTQMLPTGKEL